MSYFIFSLSFWVENCLRMGSLSVKNCINTQTSNSILKIIKYLIKYYSNTIIIILNKMVTFNGLSLTQIFQLPTVQSLLVKIWYHGLLCDYDMTAQQLTHFKILKKNVTFANCFTFQMQIKMYSRLFQRLHIVLSKLECHKIYETIVNYMKSNKLNFIAFEIFGLHFLQLFGRMLEEMDDKGMGKIIRKVFIAMTEQDKAGKVRIRREVVPAEIQEEIFSVREAVESTELKGGVSSILQPSVQLQQGKRRNGSLYVPKVNNRSLSERQKLKEFISNSDKMIEKSGISYSIGERMKNKQRASLSCFMIGGFEIVDYSDSINQLHKRLLTKIRLNK